MYILFILFFVSLASIIVMIGRKLVLLKNTAVVMQEEIVLEVPYIKEFRHVTITNIKKYGHVGLVTTLRLYIRSMSLLKNKHQEIKQKIKDKFEKSISSS